MLECVFRSFWILLKICFESDFSNLDELSEKPIFLELATDFLLLIY